MIAENASEAQSCAGEQKRRATVTIEPPVVRLTTKQADLLKLIIERRLAYMGGTLELESIREFTTDEFISAGLTLVARSEGVVP